MVRLNHDHQQISLQHLLNFQVKHVIKTMRDHHLMIGKYDNSILYYSYYIKFVENLANIHNNLLKWSQLRI